MGVKHIFTTQRTLCFAICALRQHRSWRQHKDLSCVITKPGKSIQYDPEKLQGVPQLSIHFVLVVFSASRALTEKYFTIF